MRTSLASLFVCALLSSERVAWADDEAADDARYRWILAELERTEKSERTWWRVWTASYAALAAGQGTFALLIRDDGLRADATVGAVKSTLGFLATLLSPHAAVGAPAILSEMDASTAEARRKRRRRAEELLHASAKDESFGISFLPHVAAAAANLAGAYVLFHDHKRYVPGWFSLASGTFVAELQIVTQPTGSIGAWNRYVRSFRPTEGGAQSTFRVAWSVSPAYQGVVAGWSF
jgi:hypothetical protein